MTIQLPARIPDGTRYILEGEPGPNGQLRVTRRYVVLPGGERVDLTPNAAAAPLRKPERAVRRRAVTKKLVPKRRVA